MNYANYKRNKTKQHYALIKLVYISHYVVQVLSWTLVWEWHTHNWRTSTYHICCSTFHHRFDVDTQAILSSTLETTHATLVTVQMTQSQCYFITGHAKCEYISSCTMAVSVQYSNPLPTAGVHLHKITAPGKTEKGKTQVSW